MVLSVRAEGEVFQDGQDHQITPSKTLSSADLRYHDGMEVPALPEEESKNARVLERIKENAPKINIRYEAPQSKVEEGWEKPVVKDAPIPIQETVRGKELSAMP